MKPATILVVEDNTITRRMFRVSLASQGWTVEEAADGQAALAAVSRRAPDLALLDLTLPDLDGEDVMRRLLALPGPRFPVIATSGFLSKLEQAQSLAVGFVDHLFKPVDPLRLIDVVRTLLQPVAATAGAGRTLLVIDDDPVQLRLLKLQLEHGGFRVITAAGAPEALEVVERESPDACLVDVLMPEMNGFQLCHALRQHPRVHDSPVILISTAFTAESDRELAARVGASSLIERSPDHHVVIEAVAKALRDPVPTAPTLTLDRVAADSTQRLVRQLERQVGQSTGLAERLALHEAAMGVLARIRDASKTSGSLETVLPELLQHALDATGISVGCIYLVGADGAMSLRAQQGVSASPPELAKFFGRLDTLQEALTSAQPMQIPANGEPRAWEEELLARVGTRSIILVPLSLAGEQLGVLMLAAARRQAGAEWLGFAEAIGVQIAQAVALTRAVATLSTEQERFRAIAENIREVFFITSPQPTLFTD